MFNIFDKNNNMIKNKKKENKEKYPYLVEMIDESLERYKFPHYMTKHV